MVTIIKELKISDDAYSFISGDKEKGTVLTNLSKINIFVGENNSGKSRFLRSIVADEEFLFKPALNDLDDLNTFISQLKSEMINFFEQHENIGNTNYKKFLKAKIADIKEINYIKPEEDPLLPVKNYLEFINSLDTKIYQGDDPESQSVLESIRESLELYITDPEGNEHKTGNYPQGIDIETLGEELLNLVKICYETLKNPIENIKLDYKFTKYYIPILRGLRPLTQEIHKDLYKERTRKDYFRKGFSIKSFEESNIEVFTGLNAYETVNKFSRSAIPKNRRLLEDFKNYLSKTFFDSHKVEITAILDKNEKEDVLAIKIGDEHDRPIYDLGDGIQSIIILTLQLFLHKNENLLVFIEEPEQLLHPGLQRKLIETFLYEEGFENFQFFFTTHSNHFLDITLDFDDISIFAVKKELDDSENDEKIPSFTIENLSEGDTSALELLGVRNSSVYLSNCTIWVEGITDRHYLRHYLELHQKEREDCPNFVNYKEDYHYSFVEYGGNNITHWSFLDKEENPINVEKLCGKLFLLADKDQGKEERHNQLKETLGGNRVHILECKEIENLVSPAILLEVVKSYEKINDGDSLDNINIEFEYDEYKNSPLGEFIESNIIINIEDKKRKGDYKADSGTINNKDSFLKKSIKYTQNWNDLSPEAQEITEKIYKFIKDNNS